MAALILKTRRLGGLSAVTGGWVGPEAEPALIQGQDGSHHVTPTSTRETLSPATGTLSPVSVDHYHPLMDCGHPPWNTVAVGKIQRDKVILACAGLEAPEDIQTDTESSLGHLAPLRSPVSRTTWAAQPAVTHLKRLEHRRPPQSPGTPGQCCFSSLPLELLPLSTLGQLTVPLSAPKLHSLSLARG